MSRPMEFVSPAQLVASADLERRTMLGTLVVYGELGYTSVGPRRIRPGAIRLSDDLMRHKLVDFHDHGERPEATSVGYMLDVDDNAQRLNARFKVGTTAAGDSALLEASEHTRDALSVELIDVIESADGWVTSATLTRVAQVPTPAFTSSRILEVSASQQTPAALAENNNNHGGRMTPEQLARLNELRALNTRTPEEEAELATLSTLALDSLNAVDPAPVAPAVDDSTAALAASMRALTATLTAGPAVVPGGGGPAPRGAVSTRPIAELFAAQARIHQGVSAPSLEAALSDITQTANVFTTAPAFASELWSGLPYNRRFINMMTPGTLTSYKGNGWRWVVKPAVAAYAGDKAAVTSNSPTTENVPYTAARLAGAHDLDRKFIDFGDTEFIASYYAGLTASYAYLSDLQARAAIVAAGVANDVAGASGADVLSMALTAKMNLENDEATGISFGSPDYYLVNPDDYAALLDTSAQDVSAFLSALGIDPLKFTPSSAIASGKLIAGVKQAATFYELPSSPIRVETVNIANGGVDGGVFGYYATLVNAPKGIVQVTAAA